MLSHFLAVLDEMNTTLISVHDNWLFYVLDYFLAGSVLVCMKQQIVTFTLFVLHCKDWTNKAELLNLCPLDMLVFSFEIFTIMFFSVLEWIFLKD